MANSKISALTAATTPLAGTEELPIVQAGTTDRVTVANLTAGRAVSGSSFAVTGSVAPANGIYLSAANTVSIATNSAEKVQVNSSGQVGIGVVPYASVGGNGDLLQIGNPLTKAGSGLTIGATATGDIQYSNAASGTGQYAGLLRYTFSNNTFAIWTNSASRVTVGSGGDTTLVTGNLILGTAGKGIQFANTTWLETVVASYKKSSSTTIAAGTGRSDLYFSVAANQTFTVTATGLGGLATIVYGSAGEACTFFWSWNTATINILGNGGTMFAATSTPSATQFGIYKSANSSVLSFKTGTSFSPGNVSVCLIGDYAASTTDPV
jgi:hypothetical protein